ncbi:probable adenylyl-cyclase-associated protein CAP [Melanopsichium pennsylvanicum]|uniref:Adenylyl cyclase-associated protein n=2 Tax=Melanopsichium pennsylvanicum TaxID=63383 RepID=A0AAJ4XFK7_9BASI|nr:probable adenylyl-cyclase-associated protein CAP [Melanopsichium pennsylvanicum 4]SNX81560.1 probable adenylyl-cyclase-associated protein CAP [Melanopsichium pennsylvanicum]
MSAPGIGNLSTLIKRLEAATSRLEDIALHQTSGSSQRDLAPSTPTSAAGSAPPPPPPPPPASEPTKDDPPAVKAFDEHLNEALDEFKQLSAKIGGVVQEQATSVIKTFKTQRDLILLAAFSQKPAGGVTSPVFADLLKPLQLALTEVIDIRDKNRGDKQHFNHLSTVSEGIPAVGWVTVEPKPGPYVGEMKDSAQFYANRVIKDFKDTDKTHVEWSRSFTKLLEALKAYVLKTHTTGLVWNPKGNDAASFKAASNAATSGGAPPPPPPPPPAAVPSTGAAGGAAAGGMDAVFGQLNQGENITKVLKKVDASQMTHKNPELRGTETPPATKAAPPKLAAKPAQLKAKKPPKTQLDGNKWTIEYHEDNRSIVIDQTELNQTVNIFNCKNSIIQIKGKINAVQMTNCTKTSILVDTLVSSLEVTGSPSFAVQITGRAPTVLLDSCDSGQIYLSDKSLDSEIIAAKCSAINVSLPVAGGEEGEFEEFALPEQLKHTVDGLSQKGKSRIKTEVVAHMG